MIVFQPNLVTLKIYDLVDRIENTEMSKRTRGFERQVEPVPNSNDISIRRLQGKFFGSKCTDCQNTCDYHIFLKYLLYFKD